MLIRDFGLVHVDIGPAVLILALTAGWVGGRLIIQTRLPAWERGRALSGRPTGSQ